MTTEEQDAIVGRTHRELREAKLKLATLKVDIDHHAELLENAAGHLRRFLSAPTGQGPTGMTAREYALHFFATLIPQDIARKMKEFEAESERLSDLESKAKSLGIL